MEQFVTLRIVCDKSFQEKDNAESLERIVLGQRGPTVIPEEILEVEVIEVKERDETQS